MSDMIHKSEYMNNLFRYIENNMSIDLDTELLSNVGYVSRDKLYYDFYSLSGHSVKEYVRKRRLSNALALIKTTDMGLTNIAFQCGYSSYLTLWRAIKQTLGLTPSKYKSSNTYYFFPPFKGKALQSVTVASETIPNMLRILFYHTSLENIENMAVNTFLKLFPDYDGRIFGKNGKQEGNKIIYEIYLSDTRKNYNILSSYGFELTHEISCFSTVFASSIIQNDKEKINAAWDYLYTEWLQNSMFEYTDESYYEEYILKNGKPVKLKLYLPIKEREKETKISMINNPKLCFITAKAIGDNAEKIASKIVIDYLKTQYPYIIETSKKYYWHKEKNYIICGVEINPNLQIKINENMDIINKKNSKYLVLESSVTGDYDHYTDLLLSFAQDNNVFIEKNEIFAIYNAEENFHNPKIKMYCPLKNHTK